MDPTTSAAAPSNQGVTAVGKGKWEVMGTVRSVVDKIKAEEGRKVELAKVRQEYIDALLSRPPRCDLGPSIGIADRIPVPELPERIRATMADFDEVVRMARSQDANIIEQYRRNGVAFLIN